MVIPYKVVSLAERYDLFEKQNKIGGEGWPEFMLHDPVAIDCWMQLVEAFADYQLMILDGPEILAVINTVPLTFDEDLENLPDEGVDWGVKKSIEDFKAKLNPNTLMGVQVVISREHQGKGLSKLSVEIMQQIARKNALKNLVLPLRPSNKHDYPLIPMEAYIGWKNENGAPFDNWLRVHLRLGGKIVKICSHSMSIPGTVDEWQEWTGLTFPGSGQYIVSGAINPISIDKENNQGIYIEPNIWIQHTV